MGSEMCIRDSIREMEERHRRQDFLIISGLPDDRAGSVEDRKQRDKALVSSLVQEIGHSEFVPVDMLRIGDLNTPSPRLLRVKCPSKERRTALLYDAKKLRFHQTFKKVFINPDLNRKQRESNKKLRAEVKRRREAGDTVFIRDGHLIELRWKEKFSLTFLPNASANFLSTAAYESKTHALTSTSRYSQYKLLTLNARNLCNKLHLFESHFRDVDPDFIAITETWAHPSLSDSIFAVSSYNIFRKDRVKRRGGGVFIYVRSTFQPSRVMI